MGKGSPCATILVMETITKSLAETKQLAADFINELSPGVDRATVVALRGDLGAGKTAFTQGLAEALGIIETVISPTFVIEKIYDLPLGSKFKRLIHIDAYRLERVEELVQLGFADLLSEPGHLIVIEWPERVADVLPAELVNIDFKFIDDTTRSISYGH